MDWVAEFYRRQNEWTGCYTGPLTDAHLSRAEQVSRLLAAGNSQILELGCGGGQISVALAQAGHQVTGIDLNTDAVIHAITIASGMENPPEFITGDFYRFTPVKPMDAVCYFDGFGTGTDSDQRRLLQLSAEWLMPGGLALIDVYTPWYWSTQAGREMQFGTAMRRYGYDRAGQRMLDCWWPVGNPEQAVTQSLRCYSTAEFAELIRGLPLILEQIVPAGAMDYTANKFLAQVPLEQAMAYLAVLRRVDQV